MKGIFSLLGYEDGIYFIVTGDIGCAVRRIGDSLYMCFADNPFYSDPSWSFETDSADEARVRSYLEERVREFTPDEGSLRRFNRLTSLFSM